MGVGEESRIHTRSTWDGMERADVDSRRSWFYGRRERLRSTKYGALHSLPYQVSEHKSMLWSLSGTRQGLVLRGVSARGPSTDEIKAMLTFARSLCSFLLASP